MLYQRLFASVFWILQAVSMAATGQLPAKAAPKQEYISATIGISARGFKSLEDAYEELAKNNLKRMKLAAKAVPQAKYHMTIAGFDIEVAPNLSQKQKNALAKEIDDAMTKAANDAIRKTLKSLGKKPIALPFEQVEVMKKWILAIFASTNDFEILAKKTNVYFKNNVAHLLKNGTITAIKTQQKVIKPHVGLAKITDPSFAGTALTPKTPVADFHISKPVAFVSVQWRS